MTFFYFLFFFKIFKRLGSLGGAAVWRLPLAQGAILETRDRIPHRAPGAWSLLLPLPMSLPLSLSLSLYVCNYRKKKNKKQRIGLVVNVSIIKNSSLPIMDQCSNRWLEMILTVIFRPQRRDSPLLHLLDLNLLQSGTKFKQNMQDFLFVCFICFGLFFWLVIWN